ncbi:MAG: hypothetical protein PHI58_01800 [Candidatus Omnitrophica bacterium]|nr:hypothetical protein [Candidatus Omnitrophota bacterium]
MAKKLLFFAVIASLALGQTAATAEGGLWRIGQDKGSIKVYVGEPENRSGQNKIVKIDFKKALESALLNRKSVKFELAKTPQESDVQIYSVIKKFMYMERGPIKPTPGLGTTLLDMAASATMNYAEMAVEFAVIKTDTGELVWKELLNPHIKEKMSAEDSIPLISNKIASNFVWKCFGKPSD